MQIAEIIRAAHPPRAGWAGNEFQSRKAAARSGSLQSADDAEIREAATTMADYLRSLRQARFLVYTNEFRPVFIGQIDGETVFPDNLEQRLIEPSRKGFTLDLEILKPFHRWVSIVCGPGGGPAKRVVQWREAPRVQGPWMYGARPRRMRRVTTTVGDLISAASGDI